MKNILTRANEGWTLTRTERNLVGFVSELSFLVDLKRRLAPFAGTSEYVMERMESIRKRCRRIGGTDDFNKYIRIVSLGVEIDELEASYMLTEYRLPKRVGIRLRRRENSEQ